MFVLSRTVWVRNSLFITVEGEMFSLVKISGRLYKSCMCLIYKHLHDCDNIKHIQDLYNLPDIFTNENISPSTAMNKE